MLDSRRRRGVAARSVECFFNRRAAGGRLKNGAVTHTRRNGKARMKNQGARFDGVGALEWGDAGGSGVDRED